MMAASRFAGFPDILTVPNQPSSCFAFLKHPFGKQNRSFQCLWFTQWKFIHYDEANDTVCFLRIPLFFNNISYIQLAISSYITILKYSHNC